MYWSGFICFLNNTYSGWWCKWFVHGFTKTCYLSEQNNNYTIIQHRVQNMIVIHLLIYSHSSDWNQRVKVRKLCVIHAIVCPFLSCCPLPLLSIITRETDFFIQLFMLQKEGFHILIAENLKHIPTKTRSGFWSLPLAPSGTDYLMNSNLVPHSHVLSKVNYPGNLL